MKVSFKNRIFLSMTFYVLVVTIIATIIYYRNLDKIYLQVDQRLGGLAATVQYVLADDFHDRALLKESITPEEDLQNIKHLTLLARQSGVAYLYSVIIQNGQIFLTASSASEEEIASKSEVRYFAAYNEAVHLLLVNERNIETPKFVTYTDRWGTFRAGLLLRKSPSGRPYISAAEIDVSHINKDLQNELLLTIGASFLLLAASIPLYLVFFNRLRSSADSLRDTNERLVDEQKTRIRLEAGLMQAQKMEAIGTLAGGIAHEFNNMLAIIMGNNELIMEDLPKGSLARQSTEEIRIAGLRARDVVKQLLTFSKQDDAAHKVMDFKLVVQESMKLIRSSTPVNIKIEQSLSAGKYPVMGNETQINQLLINLCNNAVDALPEKGGRITIELINETIDIQQTKHQTKLNPGQYTKLIVSDNGIGMDAEILGRVFEPYFTTKDIGEGTGIGMAVVHGIVERHGGAIIVDSKPGRGTTFTTFLPAHEGLSEQETDEQDILPVGDEYILYVDDEPSIAILGKRLLESLGYTTESTTDPEKALDMVRSNPNKFDLLITDMAMPNMTGDQLVIEILKIRRDMPTIICTGYSAKISEEEATEIGVRSYIMKPINKSELAKKVRNVLDGANSPPHVST